MEREIQLILITGAITGIVGILSGILGAWINNLLTSKRREREILFNAKKKAYSKLVSSIDLVLSKKDETPDKTGDLCFWDKASHEVCALVSECNILAEKKLREKIKYFDALQIAIFVKIIKEGAANPKSRIKIVDELIKTKKEMEQLMRKELGTKE